MFTRLGDHWFKAGSLWTSHCFAKLIVPTPTLPETNIAPENGWLKYYFPFGDWKVLAVIFMECTPCTPTESLTLTSSHRPSYLRTCTATWSSSIPGDMSSLHVHLLGVKKIGGTLSISRSLRWAWALRDVFYPLAQIYTKKWWDILRSVKSMKTWQ